MKNKIITRLKEVQELALHARIPATAKNAVQNAYDRAIQIVEEEADGWIPVEDRLPNKEEYLKDDGRFMLDDGNRRYQGLFDIYDGKFKFTKHISGLNYELFEDKCVIAWQPLPEPYHKGE